MTVIELIDSPARLDAFRAEWAQWVRDLPPANPFRTPEWLLTWWKHFGSGQLRVLVFRNAETLVGVVPCFLHEWNGRRQLTLIGSGITDYLDPALEPRHAPAILAALKSHLMNWTDWEICDWQDLSADSPLCALGPAREDTPGSRIVLDGSFEAFLAARPKDLRRNLRRYKEKAQERGSLRFAVDAQARPELLSALIDLHAARWQVAGEPGTIEGNRAGGFLREIAGILAPADQLRIFTLYYGKHVAAIILALRSPTTIFSYLSAFDPQYETFGFGRELLAQGIRYAYEQGYRYWDFLRGEEPYKFSWGAQPVAKRRVLLSRSMAALHSPRE